MNLNQIYRPITATPFKKDDTYMEFEPCVELKPYIRCFWGTLKPYRQIKTDIPSVGLVIPDTCMDIIFDINYTENCIYNTFSGINLSSFHTNSQNNTEMLVSTFGIRFYAWTAVLFSEDSMKDVKNSCYDVGYHFAKLKRELEPMLFDIKDMKERISKAEAYLLKQIHLERQNHIIMQTITKMIQNKGNITMKSLEQEIHISNRQIERLFKENIGISPKQLASLIRYQYFWNHLMYKNNFNLLDEVFQLGYTDQSHVIKDFKRFHTMTPVEAKKKALKGVMLL